jgi:hypothetical protein
MLGLTPLGAFHTAVSLIAVAAGLIAYARNGEITADNAAGRIYLYTTALTALTAYGVVEHGGEFGMLHTIGSVTLGLLVLAVVAGKTDLLGRMAPYVEVGSYSATFFFHVVVGVTEGAIHFPAGAPLVATRDHPTLQAVTVVMLVIFLVGTALQLRGLRARFRRY